MRVLSFLVKDSTVYLNKSACVCVGSFHSFSKPIILMPVCHSLRITRFDFSLFFFFFFLCVCLSLDARSIYFAIRTTHSGSAPAVVGFGHSGLVVWSLPFPRYNL